jgi:hypothetical protein
MIGLIILGVSMCAVVGAIGLWLLRRGLKGIPLENAIFKAFGVSIEGHVGFVTVAAALVVAAWLISRYEPAVQAENTRLTKDNAQLTSELQDTQKERDGLANQLRDEKARSDQLGNDLRARTAEKQQVEGQLAFTQLDLSKTKAELTRTQGLLTDETALAKDLSDKNESLGKQLGATDLERREAQGQALAAWQTADRVALSAKQQAEFNDIQKGVLDLNTGLTQLRIATAYWPRIEGKNAVATYEIYQKAFEADQTRPRGAGLFDFNSQDYKIKGNYNGRLAEALRADIGGLICEAARRAIGENVPLPEAVRDMPPIRQYDMNRDLLTTLSEFQYVRMRLQVMAGRALVLVRGYADGEQGPWRQNLDPSLATVRLHENADPNTKQPEYALTFRPNLTQVSVGKDGPNGSTYGNDDLPNLRGEEVSEILSALIGRCPESLPNTSAGTMPIEVLEGRVYPQHSEIDRKGRVHLLVFLKEQ